MTQTKATMCRTSLSNGLKTSLVIPTFQMSARSSSAGHAYAPSMGARRPFSFFYLHNHHGDASANGSSSGMLMAMLLCLHLFSCFV